MPGQQAMAGAVTRAKAAMLKDADFNDAEAQPTHSVPRIMRQLFHQWP